MKNNDDHRRRPADQKEQWQSMEVDYVGNVSELVLGGTGKLSNTPSDPGENRKVKSTG